ncbi:MAG: hypothetical protein A3I61_17280 [Acidobacteria bacterium RIFCSPLOWO2_02_FULL_68_18]|nr:MAG: hypothetical protein A3I61_17280 [Acidobacteria bacterium RIFCSPLOWO2_02_FULL_68_18]OFW50432.1 MAG: hypothetical protein A3G77_11855 [Acidobacteria bacterium RIFCSPLOWO2_12_FULL_68_19]
MATRSTVAFLASGVLPYLWDLIRDELVLRGFAVGFDRLGGPAVIGEALVWMAGHALQSAIVAVVLWVVVTAALSERHVRKSAAQDKPGRAQR